MSKKLLVRPNPFPDESLLGYIARLSEVNGYKSPKDILKIFQSIDYQFTSNLPKRIYMNSDPLMELTGKSYSTLKPMIYARMDYHKYKFMNSAVAFRMIEPCRPKFCPLCLREKSYYRIIWDFSLVTVCPAHKCLLISNCPECNSELDIYLNGFGKCKCGFDLRETQAVEELSETEFRITEHVYLLLGLRTSESDLIRFHNPLINFSLDEFSLLIDYFSKLLLRMYDTEDNPNYRKTSNYNWHVALQTALAIFDNFPQNYLLFVQEQIKAPCFADSEHDYASFSRYYPSLHNASPDSSWSFIYKAFIENIYSLLKKNSIVSKKKRYIPQARYIPIAEAQKNLNVTKKEFKFLLSTGQLDVKYLDWREKHLFVKSDSYLIIKSEKLTWIKDSELASQLDISDELVKQLAYDGYLPIKMQDYSSEYIYYYFEGDLFIKLLSWLRSRIKNKPLLNRDKLLDFEEIEETLNPDIQLLSNFVGLCIKGKIRPRQELLDKDGIRRFLFAEKDVERFIEVFL
jgi:hypothetical protein